MHRTMRSSIRGLFVLSEPWEIDGRPNDNMGLFQSSPTAVFDLRKTKIQIQSTNKKFWQEIMVRFTQFPIYTGLFQVQVWEIDGRRNDNEIFQDFHPWRNFSHHLLLWSVPSPQSSVFPPKSIGHLEFREKYSIFVLTNFYELTQAILTYMYDTALERYFDLFATRVNIPTRSCNPQF